MKNIFIIILALILIACEKEVSTTQPEALPPKAKLFIDSEPSGSLIYSNGKNTGRRTPDSLSWIESGDYLITLKRQYYKDTSFSMVAQEDVKITKYIDYHSNPSMYGAIEFTSNPKNAEIIINDSSIGLKTPTTIDGWLPGKYKVNYRLENHRDSEVNIIVESDKRTKASSALKDTTVWVDFQTNNSELPNNTLTCITVDDKDLLWIGTESKGIITYDGSNFNVINSTNSMLPSNKINSIHIDKDDTKWICTDNGLALLDVSNSMSIFNKDNSELSTNKVTTVYFGSNYQLVGTGNGLIKIKNGVWKKQGKGGVIIDGRDLSLIWINDIEVIADTFFLATTHLGVLALWDTKFYKHYDLNYNGIHTEFATVVTKDETGSLWFGMNSDSISGGISVYDGENWEGDKFANYNDAIFEDVYIDDKNDKWFSSKNALFRVKNINSKSKLTNINWGLTINHTTGVVQTKNKVYWITTFGGGLIKYKGN